MLGGVGAVGRVGRVGAATPSKGGGVISGVDLDFSAGRYALNSPYRVSPADIAGWTFSRTSAGTAETTDGTVLSYATGVPRIVPGRGLLVEGARTNLVTGGNFAGATVGVIGSGGAAPTGWNVASGTGLTAEIVQVGTENGAAFIDIRWAGTNTSGGALFPGLQSATFPATAGSIYTKAVTTRRVAGSAAGIPLVGLLLQWRQSPDLFLGNSTTASDPLDGAGRRLVISNITAPASTVGVRSNYSAAVNAGQSCDFTVRFSMPQLELGAFPTSYIPTTGSAATRGVDAAAIVAPSNVTTYTATYNNGLTATGAVTPSASFDLVTGRPWLNGYLQRIVMS